MKLLSFLPFLAHNVLTQDEVLSVEEYSDKCIDCIFSNAEHYFCPTLGICIQSSTDKSEETCHEEQPEGQ